MGAAGRPNTAGRIKQMVAAKIDRSEIGPELELDLIHRAKAGDRGARETLDRANLPLVYLVVRRYLRHGVDDEDLLQEARIGLQHAIDKFNPELGWRFGTYAVNWIKNYAADYLARNCSDIRVATKVRGARWRMLRRGRTPDEMSASADPSDRAVVEHYSALCSPLSLDTRSEIDGELGGELCERVPSADPPPDEALDSVRTRAAMASLLSELVATLPPQERDVLSRRYPLDEASEPETQVRIAEGSLRADGRVGPTRRQRVNQIERKALERLAVRIAVRDPTGDVVRGRRIDVDPSPDDTK